jgi:hypothetical protein
VATLNAPNDNYSPLVDNADLSKPIAVARSIVRVIRASGLRREAFNNVIKDGNDRRWFKEGTKVMTLPELQLLRNIQSRWDSVYKMLQRLRIMRLVSFNISLKLMHAEQFFYQAIDYFFAQPNNDDLARYKLSPQVWDTLRNIEAVLSVSCRYHIINSLTNDFTNRSCTPCSK